MVTHSVIAEPGHVVFGRGLQLGRAEIDHPSQRGVEPWLGTAFGEQDRLGSREEEVVAGPRLQIAEVARAHLRQHRVTVRESFQDRPAIGRQLVQYVRSRSARRRRLVDPPPRRRYERDADHAAELFTRTPHRGADGHDRAVAELVGVPPGRAGSLVAVLSGRWPDDAAQHLAERELGGQGVTRPRRRGRGWEEADNLQQLADRLLDEDVLGLVAVGGGEEGEDLVGRGEQAGHVRGPGDQRVGLDREVDGLVGRVVLEVVAGS